MRISYFLQIRVLEGNIEKAEAEIYRLDGVLEKIRLVSCSLLFYSYLIRCTKNTMLQEVCLIRSSHQKTSLDDVSFFCRH